MSEPTPQQQAAAAATVAGLVAAQGQAYDKIENGLAAGVKKLMDRMFNRWYFQKDVDDFVDDVIPLVRHAQEQIADLTQQYMESINEAMGVVVKPSMRDFNVELPKRLRQVDPKTEWNRPARQARVARLLGADEFKANEDAQLRAQQMARMDALLAMQEAEKQMWGVSDDIIGYRRIIHPELGNGGPVCGLCVAAASRTYSKIKKKSLHGGCVPPWAKIRADRVSAVTRRHYSGELVVLRVTGGHDLTVTPNHPVLTARGWVPAGLVDESDHVVRDNLSHRESAGGPDEHDDQVTAEEVWRAATVDSGLDRSVVPLTTEDFHGDGTDGEVDVVSTEGFLADVRHVTFHHPLLEQALMDAWGDGVPFTPEGAGADLIFGNDTAGSGGVGVFGEGLALCSGHTAIAERVGAGAVSTFDASFGQAAGDGWARDPVLGGDREFAHAGHVVSDDAFAVEILALTTRFDPAGLEFTAEDSAAYANLGVDLIERLAGRVQLDRVLETRRVSFTGHVFNFQTAEGWYESDGHIVSNCRCTVLPITKDGSGIVTDPGFDLNRNDLDRIYKEAGGTGAAALRTINVTTFDHGELGPILVNAKYRNRKTKAPKEDAVDKMDPQKLFDIQKRIVDEFDRKVREGTTPQFDIEYHRRQLARLAKELGISLESAA